MPSKFLTLIKSLLKGSSISEIKKKLDELQTGLDNSRLSNVHIQNLNKINLRIIQIKKELEDAFTESQGHLDSIRAWADMQSPVSGNPIENAPKIMTDNLNNAVKKIEKLEEEACKLMVEQGKVSEYIDKSLKDAASKF